MKIERDPTLAPAVGGPAAPTGASVAAQRRTEIGGNDAAAHGAAARPAATVELSARSRELHEALRAADAAGDVRADVVKQIKAQVDAGTYSIDPAAIARGMLDRRA